MRLYELPDAIRLVEQAIADNEGELTPEMEAQLDALEGEMERKVEYLAMLAREAKAEAAAVKQEEDRLKARRSAASNREAGIKRYLDHCLRKAGIDRVEGALVKIRIQQNSQPSVIYDGDPNDLPPQYQRVTVVPDVAALKADHDAGAELPDGVFVAFGSHLRIW